MNVILLYFTIILHFLLVFAFTVSFFILPFKEPWYVAFPIMVFQVFFVTNRFKCIITETENHFRKKLGKPEIRGFLGHYIYMPIRKIKRKI